MRVRSRQVIALSVALAMLMAGFASVMLGRSESQTAQAAGVYTIEILANSFNPPICVVNRNGSEVNFLNKDTKPRRIVAPSVGMPGEFRFDTGVIQPGATNPGGWLFQGVDRVEYQDFDTPALEGIIEVPVDPNAASQCDPLPPTPTPTATPTRTPTPLPTLPPPPTPEACVRLLNDPKGCAVAIWVSNDGPLE